MIHIKVYHRSYNYMLNLLKLPFCSGAIASYITELVAEYINLKITNEYSYVNVQFNQGGQKTWNLRNFENNLEFCTKVVEKPGISYKKHGKTWIFFFNLNVLTILI